MPTTTADPQVIDTRVMPMLHSAFRREFGLAPALVAGVAPGATSRARVVCDHLDLLVRTLHHHHTVEDELLWPVLLERVPEELAPLVHLMESQHERVDTLLTEIGALLPTFAVTASADEGRRLAELLADLHVGLVEHLEAEEEQLLPIVARSVTQAEWDALGEAGRAGTPKPEMSLVLGMYLHEATPEVAAMVFAGAPAPVRWLVPRLARRAFRRHSVKVHGTPAP